MICVEPLLRGVQVMPWVPAADCRSPFRAASGAAAAETGLPVCGLGAPSLRFVNPRNAFWML